MQTAKSIPPAQMPILSTMTTANESKTRLEGGSARPASLLRPSQFSSRLPHVGSACFPDFFSSKICPVW